MWFCGSHTLSYWDLFLRCSFFGKIGGGGAKGSSRNDVSFEPKEDVEGSVLRARESSVTISSPKQESRLRLRGEETSSMYGKQWPSGRVVSSPCGEGRSILLGSYPRVEGLAGGGGGGGNPPPLVASNSGLENQSELPRG